MAMPATPKTEQVQWRAKLYAFPCHKGKGYGGRIKGFETQAEATKQSINPNK